MGGLNKIVVDYGDYEGLVLLGAFDTETGVEVSRDELENLEGFELVKKYDGINDYANLKSMISDNEEGYVVRFSNGDRMKIKGEEYLRLHKIMTNVSTTSIWEILSSGSSMDELLNNVPDEFYQKIKEYSQNLKYGYFQISEYCGKAYDYFRYGKYNDKEIEPTKKEFAEYVQKHIDKRFWSVMFAMWDGKDYEHIIWNIIKPRWKRL